MSSSTLSRHHASKSFAGRNALYGSIIAIAMANGFSEKILASVAEQGLLSALFNSFNVSVVVWLALAAGFWLLQCAPPVQIRVWDVVAAFGASALILVPVPALSWVAATALSMLFIIRSSSGSLERRAGYVLLAATVPAFWAGVIMSVFNEWILTTDAFLVGLFVGSTPEGNLVPFADNSGALWIAPACSSFTNLSLAILAIVTAVNVTSGKWSPPTIAHAAAACASVVLINVTRIGLIGYFPNQFDLIHGDLGATIAGLLSVLAIAVFTWLAVRRHALALG